MKTENTRHPSEFRLKCPECNSIEMRVYEGRNIATVKKTRPDRIEEEITFPLEVYCAYCGRLLRQEGGPVL